MRAWYGATISEFLAADDATVLGQIAQNSALEVVPSQRDAWLAQIHILRGKLHGLHGSVFFEFNIPRMGRRVDVILLIGPVVFVLEFKVGERKFDRAAMEQVWDYALDVKNFHEASHGAAIVPVLVVTNAAASAPLLIEFAPDQVAYPVQVNAAGLRDAINRVLQYADGPPINAQHWANAPYRPTPTIIEAAQALYARHSVAAIARCDAGAQNLHVTSSRIEELADEARAKKQKYICFVTGVPGAGKTLVGLNVATRRRETDQPTHAVFLSGNGPLVAVLREALTRDECARLKSLGKKFRKGTVGESVKVFIQNVHHFRDEGFRDSQPPSEHVVIFDEAQRAWNARQTASFMQRKKGRADFNLSEPEFLISCMDRHQDWAMIVCLVGGGQEINTGEAGIESWLKAVRTRFPHWRLFLSPCLTDSEYAAGRAQELVRNCANTCFDESLHLSVSMRSFRAEKVSAFVKALLDVEPQRAREFYSEFADRYPIVLTRDLAAAKTWLRSRARGSERFGLVASSKAMRLKPHAIDIRLAVDPKHYFLNGREDTRSSYYLEDAATEFKIQGLELDWVGVSWDADFRYNPNANPNARWSYHDFRGSRWTHVAHSDRQLYMRNAYRVLLTRARQGMVIFIPPGDSNDPTRSPEFYNHTFQYLRNLGIPEVG